jgi:hypothetical protein
MGGLWFAWGMKWKIGRCCHLMKRMGVGKFQGYHRFFFSFLIFFLRKGADVGFNMIEFVGCFANKPR